MAFIITEQVKSSELKPGDYVSKGPGSYTYKVHEVTDKIKLSKIGETLIVGFPKAVFDTEVWFRCRITEKALPEIIVRQKVESSNLESVGYDDQTLTLDVEVKGGSVYRYLMVPKEIAENFLKSDSKGRYLHNMIKDKYEFKKR